MKKKTSAGVAGPLIVIVLFVVVMIAAVLAIAAPRDPSNGRCTRFPGQTESSSFSNPAGSSAGQAAQSAGQTTRPVKQAATEAQVAQPAGKAEPAPELSREAKVDRVFERWDHSDTPGCVVGVAVDGRPVLVRAYGMANLEYGLSIRPDTLFESGSVAKQFTAASIALLALDGKLSLDDPVRKYLPEVPDFGGPPILIRHFLNHTSGLRSQWPLLALSGRETGRAVHTVDEILELVSGLRELNFKPGDEYLYNNTGYTLLGVIVQRVSGKSLAEFSRERLFAPLGMTHTEWRDDFTKIVPDRATAYRQDRDGKFWLNMPFTNVYGNGGLLTTVGDLLIWNANLDTPRVGGQAMVDMLQTRGWLNDGFEIEYAEGLVVTTYKGVREISHGGSTAGYQTFLARFPEQRVSIAVLSNVTTSRPSRLAHEVADIFLAGAIREPPKPVAVAVPAAMLKTYAGVYREPLTDAALHVELDKDGKTLKIGGEAAVATSWTTFVSVEGARQMVFEAGAGSVTGPRAASGTPSASASGKPSMAGAPPASGTRVPPMRIVETDGGHSKPRFWEAMAPFAPKPEDLAAYAGTYHSDEIDMTYTVYVEGGNLKVHFRPATRFELSPAYADAFEADGDVIRFTRDTTGAIDGFLVYAGRVRHLRFVRRR